MAVKKFIIAGGGTGGHIFPAIAIANALKKLSPGAEFLFVGALGKMEMEKVPQAGFDIKGLTITGFNRSSLIKNISLPWKLVNSFFQVADIVRKFRPDAVIGVGGYSTYPVLRYAQTRGIPTFIHESNSFAGKSNIMLGKKATRIFTAIEGMEKFFPASRIIVSGNPVRELIANQEVSKPEALQYFGFDDKKKTVLSIGGSLGAKSINEAIDKDLESFAGNGLQLIWQTGKPYLDRALERSKGMSNLYVSDFISRMELCYAAADIIISRSGAMAVSEICLVKKPVVFVPYPHAAEDHQTVNARILVDKGAAKMIKDADAGSKLVPEIIALSKNEEMQRELIRNIEPLGIKDADLFIAKSILEYC